MKQKPNLSVWKLWNLSFGFFGVQIAYALQSGNISRIFRTLGADPHSLSFFWILPPLMGILVQPIVGTLSDKTWTRFGRRIPYLFVGAAVAVAVMCLLPNAGSFGMSVATALIFGLFALMLLDTSINMAMQPFKMLVGDMVNEEQKAKAYSIQSFLCNAGSVVGFLFPFIFATVGLSNVAPEGVVPDTVIWSFYIGAAILILCVLYTTLKVKEWPPKEYAEYNPVSEEKEESANWFVLLKNAPSTFWKVGLVQFFCWAGMLYMWTYVVDAVSETVWGTTDAASEAYQDAGNWTGVLYAIQAMGSVAGWSGLPAHSLHGRQVYADYSLPAHRLRLGRHARHAFHVGDECLAGLRPHGCLPGTVQWHHLRASDCGSPSGWQYSDARWRSSVNDDDCGRRALRHRFLLRFRHQGEVVALSSFADRKKITAASRRFYHAEGCFL